PSARAGAGGLPGALLSDTPGPGAARSDRGDPTPAPLCGNVNRLLCRHMVSGRFVTFCFAWIDVDRRALTYANAGHNPPLLLRPDGSVERLSEGGMVMGVFEDAVFKQAEVAIAPGDRLFFYTDGIT